MVDLYLGEVSRANQYCEQSDRTVLCFDPNLYTGDQHERLVRIPVPAHYNAAWFAENYFHTIIIDTDSVRKLRFLVNTWRHAFREMLIIPAEPDIIEVYSNFEFEQQEGNVYHIRKVGLCA